MKSPTSHHRALHWMSAHITWLLCSSIKRRAPRLECPGFCGKLTRENCQNMVPFKRVLLCYIEIVKTWCSLSGFYCVILMSRGAKLCVYNFSVRLRDEMWVISTLSELKFSQSWSNFGQRTFSKIFNWGGKCNSVCALCTEVFGSSGSLGDDHFVRYFRNSVTLGFLNAKSQFGDC